MDFENTLADCIRNDDVEGLRSLRLNKELVNRTLICPTPIPQYLGIFSLPQISFPKPLLYAVLCQKPKIVNELLDFGAEVKDNSKNNLYQAIHYAIMTKNYQTTEVLLNHDKNQLTFLTDSQNSPLHLAVASGDYSIVKLLLDLNADPNQKNIDGNTPLHYASTSHDIRIIQYLISHGANPTIPNNNSQTPLDLTKDSEFNALLKTYNESKI
jgi:ankyrin repeat protein